MSVLASDDFNRANNGDLGANWTPQQGGGTQFSLTSNAVGPDSLGSDSGEYYSGRSWPDDQYAQAKITATGTTGGGRGIGLALRQASAAHTHYRIVADHAAASNVELSKRIAGAKTALWSRTQSWTDGATIRGEVQGTTLRVFLTGVQVGADQTDAAIATGSPGIMYSSTVTAATLDDWEGGDFTAAGVNPRPLVVTQAVHRASFY